MASKTERIQERATQLLSMANPWKREAQGDKKGVKALNLRSSYRKGNFTFFLDNVSDEDIDIECAALKVVMTTYRDLAKMSAEERATALKGTKVADFYDPDNK